ncbi:hypothetical protein HQ520_09245 [bacterium]|nr:hypothetical protein [bacterium]
MRIPPRRPDLKGVELLNHSGVLNLLQDLGVLRALVRGDGAFICEPVPSEEQCLEEYHVRRHNDRGTWYIPELGVDMHLTRAQAEHVAALQNHWRRLRTIRRREWLKPGPEHYPSLEVTDE